MFEVQVCRDGRWRPVAWRAVWSDALGDVRSFTTVTTAPVRIVRDGAQLGIWQAQTSVPDAVGPTPTLP
jgi:hypothetical protein